jgi:hypothetical protein
MLPSLIQPHQFCLTQYMPLHGLFNLRFGGLVEFR